MNSVLNVIINALVRNVTNRTARRFGIVVIIVAAVGLLLVKEASADTVSLRPDSGSADCPTVGFGPEWSLLSDNADSTGARSVIDPPGSSRTPCQTFSLMSDWNAALGTIDTVRIRIRGRLLAPRIDQDGLLEANLEANGGFMGVTSLDCPLVNETVTECSSPFVSRPGGGPWTDAELDSMQVVGNLQDAQPDYSSDSVPIGITEVFVDVNYTPPVTTTTTTLPPSTTTTVSTTTTTTVLTGTTIASSDCTNVSLTHSEKNICAIAVQTDKGRAETVLGWVLVIFLIAVTLGMRVWK